MEFQFSANLQYQLDAIESVVELFAGQPEAGGASELLIDQGRLNSLALTETGLANHLAISPEQILANCRRVQKNNGLPESDVLYGLTLEGGKSVGQFPNFTVEMETGTGKTYVYLRSIYALNERYGFKKFVIVVPSVAIREGVLKNLEVTHTHLQTLYNFEPCSFSVYDSSRPNELRNFALSNAIQILVINIDSFSKEVNEEDAPDTPAGRRKARGNIINQRQETGAKYIEFIQAAQPVVIVDEPQNMETEIRLEAISRLNPLCTLRYSATPKNSYNLIYQLDPVRAYELGLVKQISVDSVLEDANANHAYVSLQSFAKASRTASAKLEIWVNGPKGPLKKKVTVKNGSDLAVLSNGRDIYKDGFIVNEIDIGEGVVRFANDIAIGLGHPHGALTDEILRLQIEATVRRHFERERRLKPLGIKVLSVFFIDRVSNYRPTADGGATKGKFAIWFEEIFEQYRTKPDFATLYPFGAEAAHNGYFSQDKRGQFKDSTERGSADDNDTYALIMKDKERLLDPAEPLRFIFSHSALREGWDNPNVFQICTLAESNSEVKKRQEIGRGLRIAVDADGKRVLDPNINRLTIIANESYEDFARDLQSEMEEQGVAFKKEMVPNARNIVTVKLKKGYEADSNFLQLWEKIRQQTRYRVRYSTDELVGAAVSAVQTMPKIERPKMIIARGDLAITKAGITTAETGRKTQELSTKYVIPDLISQIQSRTSLSRSTVASIVLDAGRLEDAVNNPQAYIENASSAINATKRELLVKGVEYVKVEGMTYEMRRFEDDDLAEVFASNVVAVEKQGKTLFSHIVIDSHSLPEQTFAKACEDNDDVHFYIKLPRWFVIETPVGPYNPDWALMYHDQKVLYFVAETKGSNGHKVDLALLRPMERLKIHCGSKHFDQFEEVRFKAVANLQELLA